MACVSTGSVVSILSMVVGLEIRAARRGPRPYESAFPSDGHHGDGPGPRLRIAILGDSLAAGLGAEHPGETFPVQVSAALAGPCDLRVFAVPGATVGDVVSEQLPRLDAAVDAGFHPDLVVISAGANDLAALTRKDAFQRRYGAVLDAADRWPTVVLSIPDLGMAERLARPLRWIAAARARQIDSWLTAVLAGRPGVARADARALPTGTNRTEARRLMSRDRFHPGGVVYGMWADRVADAYLSLAA